MAGKGRPSVGMEGLVVRKGAPPPVATAPQRGPAPIAEPEVQERQVALTVKVPASLYSRLRRYAVDEGRTHQDVCLAALRGYLDQ